MFFLRDAVSRFGFANTLSVISFVISITCFAFVARISQQYAKIELNKTEPKVIIANNEAIKIAVDKSNYDLDSTVYDNIVTNIDSVANSNDDKSPIVKAKKATIKIENPEPIIETQIPEKEISENNITENVKKQQMSNKKNIQLGIFKSHREAVSAWFKMSDKNSNLGNLRYHVVAKKSTGDQYLYLLQIKAKNNQEAEKLAVLLISDGLSVNVVD
jgi:hypothetical protein